MSRYFSTKYDALTPYTPGEQPADLSRFVKLNTNESPYAPSDKALAYAKSNTRSLNLYSDPNTVEFCKILADQLHVDSDQIVPGNGSDEILNFAFMAFCDKNHPAAFPNISYGFYPVFAEQNGIPYQEIPLNPDFTINISDYIGINKTIFIANPNAPTGIALTRNEIEQIIVANPDNVVVIDEAYVDFGGESCIPLIERYDNLLVVQTFSKSRSMAGARLGFGVGSKALISDMNTLRYSTNPYNINSMTLAMGIGTLLDQTYYDACCQNIIEDRTYTTRKLQEMGFDVKDSSTNFVFAATDRMDGGRLYEALKENGVLVRHFNKPEIRQYLRITIGTHAQMDILLEKIKKILEAEA